jgi:hypothetical protein
MVATSTSSSTSYASGAALLSAAGVVCGAKRSFAAMQSLPEPHMTMTADPTQKRSPLLCGYPSKKCWAWRVEKRNGELHKFCEYHRQKANTNQRRMEQRRKTGRSAQKGDDPAAVKEEAADAEASSQQDATIETTSAPALKPEQMAVAPSTPMKTHVKTAPPMINTAMANAEKAAVMMKNAVLVGNNNYEYLSGSPRGIDHFDGSPRGVDHFDAMSPPLFSWAEVDLDIGMDAAVEYMMIDHAIDAEPSDKPVDLYEEDLYFLEHFIAEIAASVM